MAGEPSGISITTRAVKPVEVVAVSRSRSRVGRSRSVSRAVLRFASRAGSSSTDSTRAPTTAAVAKTKAPIIHRIGGTSYPKGNSQRLDR